MAHPGEYDWTVRVRRPEVGCLKTAGSIEMPYGRHTPVDPTNHVLDGVHIDATCWIPLTDNVHGFSG